MLFEHTNYQSNPFQLFSLPSSYLEEGFLHLQNIVSQSIVEWKSGQLLNVSVAMRVQCNNNYKHAVSGHIICHRIDICLWLCGHKWTSTSHFSVVRI